MPIDVLIRGVPRAVSDWVDAGRQQWSMSRQEFLVKVLERCSQQHDGPLLFDVALPSIQEGRMALPFSFIDVFAGIGGFRFGLEAAGGRCLWTCEWDKYSQKTYKAWHGDMPHGDIRKIAPKDIPDHDLLAAGFPCQPFSIAGVSKKASLGRAHGFKCQAQGTLFFTLAGIIEAKRPPVVLLENVKNLRSHDRGRTWQVIQGTLSDLGYEVYSQVIDAARWVPQHRERVFIVGFDRQVFGKNPPFEFLSAPTTVGSEPRLCDILQDPVDERYTLTPHLWNYLQRYAAKHKAAGNGFGFGLAQRNGISRTLSARYYKDGSEILVPPLNPEPEGQPRRLTPTEAARLMGFCGDYAARRGCATGDLPIVVSDTQAYRQFGNAVCPPVVESVAWQIVSVLRWQLQRRNGGCLLKRPHGRTRVVDRSTGISR